MLYQKHDAFMEILNKEFDVIHDTHWKGKTCGYITKFEGGYTHYYIKVKFFDGEEKAFYFPDQFRFHLKAVDQKIQAEIMDLMTGKPPEPPERKLIFGAVYGTNSRDIYVQFCKYFDWKLSMKEHFGVRTLMYAKNCTPEVNSVWFIPHNSVFEKYNENSHWFNFIKGNIIEEVWIDYENSSLHNDWDDRVTFLKTKDGYAFYGIYRPQEIIEKEINHKIRKVKIYKQISAEYSSNK